MTQAAMRIESLQVTHGARTVLDLAHLEVEREKVLALIGPNGAGKSTLLQVLGFLQRPTQGRVFFEGQEVTASTPMVPLRRRLALVFQEPLLFHGTVSDNVALGLRLRGVSRAEIRRRTEIWLSKLHITHLADRSVVKLSVGEAQRVNLARSLALDPEVFLLDEPFASLDPPTQASMVEEFQNILAETKTTTVLVTHNRTEALMLGDRMGVLMDGRIAQLDRPQNVFAHPANESVAAFLGVETMVRGRVLTAAAGKSKVDMGGHQIVVAGSYSPGEGLLFCLRSDEIVLLGKGAEADSGSFSNVIRGTVSRVTPLENQFKVVVDCSSSITVLVSRQAFIDLSLVKGKQVHLAFKPEAVHVISRHDPSHEGDEAKLKDPII